MNSLQNLRIELKKFQSDFVYSTAKFPAFVAAWGTGKTLCAILRGILCSENVPSNLGAIVRKNYTDLENSTMKDFERYTGVRISSKGEVRFANGSEIMFLPGDDLDKLKNINLGWFYIEQAEEFETADQFDFLRGRLRRAGVPFPTGFVIANANGHNWIYKRWIQNQAKPEDARDKDYFAVGATTYDNKENLPESYITDCEKLKIEAPGHYRRFILNSHDESDVIDSLISSVAYDLCKDITLLRPYERRFVSADFARYGDDNTIIMAWVNEKIEKIWVFKHQDLMATSGHIVKIIGEHKASLFAGDVVGLGSGPIDRIREVLQSLDYNCQIVEINGGSQSSDPQKWVNLRSEIAQYTKDKIESREVSVPDNEFLKEDLTFMKYRIMSDRRFFLEKKEEFKKRMKRSPDHGDCFMIGLWASQFARDEIIEKERSVDHYRDKRSQESFMSA